MINRIGGITFEAPDREYSCQVGDKSRYLVQEWLAEYPGQSVPCTVKAYSGVSVLVVFEDGKEQWGPVSRLVGGAH